MSRCAFSVQIDSNKRFFSIKSVSFEVKRSLNGTCQCRKELLDDQPMWNKFVVWLTCALIIVVDCFFVNLHLLGGKRGIWPQNSYPSRLVIEFDHCSATWRHKFLQTRDVIWRKECQEIRYRCVAASCFGPLVHPQSISKVTVSFGICFFHSEPNVLVNGGRNSFDGSVSRNFS